MEGSKKFISLATCFLPQIVRSVFEAISKTWFKESSLYSYTPEFLYCNFLKLPEQFRL